MSVETVPNVDDLTAMVEQVWTSYLDPEGIDPLIPSEEANDDSEVHSSVAITGSWQGAVVYGSSAAAARNAAAAFLAMEPDEVTEEDLSDVLGEMANIVGGNVKAMLPPGCYLSLPQVVLAPDTATRYPSAVPVAGLHGTWRGEPVSITMWQSRSDVKEGGVA
jgi:chemotaxis protein CheX